MSDRYQKDSMTSRRPKILPFMDPTPYDYSPTPGIQCLGEADSSFTETRSKDPEKPRKVA